MSPIAIKTAIFRAIENGCLVTRQTNMGISISANNKGQILSQNNYFLSEDKSMVAYIPTKIRFTLYPYLGNILPFICIIMIMYLSVNLMFMRRKTNCILPEKDD